MASYKALVSFSGAVSMAMGDVIEINDTPIAEDLLRAGYIIEDTQNEEKTVKKTTKKKGEKK